MPATPTRPDPIELYMMHLNAALLDIPRNERDEFLREIRAHIFEKLEQSGAEVSEVLQAVGDPEDLGRQFHSERSLTVSSRSWSPWVLLRTSARWGLNGFQGFALFLVATVGYTFAASFYICAVLKPIYPDHIGFYIGKHGLTMAAWPAPPGHEVLAPYFTMIAFVLGFLFIAGTSFVLRLMMRKFSKVRSWLT